MGTKKKDKPKRTPEEKAKHKAAKAEKKAAKKAKSKAKSHKKVKVKSRTTVAFRMEIVPADEATGSSNPRVAIYLELPKGEDGTKFKDILGAIEREGALCWKADMPLISLNKGSAQGAAELLLKENHEKVAAGIVAGLAALDIKVSP
jgi:hypothetical protein